jgi:hypothetical protein
MDSRAASNSFYTHSRPRNWTESFSVAETSYRATIDSQTEYRLTRLVSERNRAGASATTTGGIFQDSQSFFSQDGTYTYSSYATYKDNTTDVTERDSTGETISESIDGGFSTYDPNNSYSTEGTTTSSFTTENKIVTNETNVYLTTVETRFMQNSVTYSALGEWLETTYNSKGKLTTMAALRQSTLTYVASPTLNQTRAAPTIQVTTKSISTIGWDTLQNSSKQSTIAVFDYDVTTIQLQVNALPYARTANRFSNKTITQEIAAPWATVAEISNFIIDAIENQPEALFWPKSFAGDTTVGKLLDVYSSNGNLSQAKTPYNKFTKSSNIATIHTIEIDQGAVVFNGSTWDITKSEITDSTNKTFNVGNAVKEGSVYTYVDTTTGYSANNFTTGTTAVTLGYPGEFTTTYSTWMSSRSVVSTNAYVSSAESTILYSHGSYEVQSGTVTLTEYIGLKSTTVGYAYTSSTTVTVPQWPLSLNTFITNETAGSSTKTMDRGITYYTEQLLVPVIEPIASQFGMTSLFRIFPKGQAGWASTVTPSNPGTLGRGISMDTKSPIYNEISISSNDLPTAVFVLPAEKYESQFTDTNNDANIRIKFFPYQTYSKFKYWSISRGSSRFRAEYINVGSGTATAAAVQVTWTTTTTANFGGKPVASRISSVESYGVSLTNTFNSTGKYYADSVYIPQGEFNKFDRFEFPGGVATNFIGGAFGGYNYFDESLSVIFNPGAITFRTNSGNTEIINTSNGTLSTSNSSGPITTAFPRNVYVAFSWVPLFSGSWIPYGNYEGKFLRQYPYPGIAGEIT